MSSARKRVKIVAGYGSLGRTTGRTHRTVIQSTSRRPGGASSAPLHANRPLNLAESSASTPPIAAAADGPLFTFTRQLKSTLPAARSTSGANSVDPARIPPTSSTTSHQPPADLPDPESEQSQEEDDDEVIQPRKRGSGHGGRECKLGLDCEFTLGSTYGIEEVPFRFCRHSGALPEAEQLIEAGIYPCSDEIPSSGFTFDALRTFHLLSCEGKLSAQRYYNVLVHRTNTCNPDKVPDRYREFLRVSRQWMLLMDLKRSGAQTARPSSNNPDLALRCPACPYTDINYQDTDIDDDHFKLYRKDKPSDRWDLCMTTGRKYFISDYEFQSYLTNLGAEGNMSTKDANCNNHRAAQGGWIRYTGLDETGIGSVICARHSMFMPRGTVNFTTGERYAYPDFVFGSVLNMAAQRGIKGIGIHYDIMCHYLVNMWARFKHLEPSLRVITPHTFRTFITAIPKFHLAGHTDGCFARFSLNFIKGVGRLDGEGNERCWANLNHAAGCTCERSPGSRVELIEHIMSQWNWAKETGLARWIVKKWKEAHSMRDEMKAAFEDFCALFERSVLVVWEGMDAFDAEGRCNFVMPETPEMSIQAQLRTLIEEENDSETPSPPVGAAAWIAEGVNIKSTQYLLNLDIQRWGTKPTARQAKETATRRKELLSRLDAHRTAAPTFLAPLPPASSKSSTETQGQPEAMPTVLPSDYDGAILQENSSHPTLESERALRRAACLKALQTLRTIAIQQSHMKLRLSKHTKGTRTSTRSNAMTARYEQRLSNAIWEYTDSRNRLKKLGMNTVDLRTFKRLTQGDVDSLTKAVTSRRPLGEGRIKLPWYWRVSLSAGPEDSEHVYLDSSIVGAEEDASLRVEWFRARERYLRWEEEIQWLQRESASLILSFNAKALQWASRSYESHHKGWRAYCRRQYATREAMTRDACTELQTILTNATGPGSKLCHRACEELTHLLQV
ncbi:unnamed protein product [Rhizoctonia solani]|uniref:CxC2-like cysteine cluster KDZ transposase-associated domain-containing protein n=1 Tax=Rhizoctonia solani TaxID=456999 RepID=A0A8H3A8G6_9AGAM|nr:unnamed protein product [Rhizoctonia solani]